jgi:hypothetical protein
MQNNDRNKCPLVAAKSATTRQLLAEKRFRSASWIIIRPIYGTALAGLTNKARFAPTRGLIAFRAS